MKCPKDGCELVAIMGISKGENAPSFAHEYTFKCGHISPAPSVPFWEAVISQ